MSKIIQNRIRALIIQTVVQTIVDDPDLLDHANTELKRRGIEYDGELDEGDEQKEMVYYEALSTWYQEQFDLIKNEVKFLVPATKLN